MATFFKYGKTGEIYPCWLFTKTVKRSGTALTAKIIAGGKLVSVTRDGNDWVLDGRMAPCEGAIG